MDGPADGVEIRREDLASPVAVSLIAALDEELSATYPEDSATHFRLDSEETVAGRGAFLVAYSSCREPLACGAIRCIDRRSAEIKRMYVASGARGQGLGRRMLEALESEARRLQVDRIVLETGERQAEALALYESAGFVRIPAFGEYVGSPLSICLAKELADTDAPG